MTKPPPSFAFRLIFRRLLSIFVTASWVGAAIAAEPAAMPFDIPADIAARSLKVFAQQSGSEVIVGSDKDGRVQTRPVKGEMTPPAALDAMLAGTGLVADRHEKTGAYAVRKETETEKNGPRAAQKTAGDRPFTPLNPTNSAQFHLP